MFGHELTPQIRYRRGMLVFGFAFRRIMAGRRQSKDSFGFHASGIGGPWRSVPADGIFSQSGATSRTHAIHHVVGPRSARTDAITKPGQSVVPQSELALFGWP